MTTIKKYFLGFLLGALCVGGSWPLPAAGADANRQRPLARVAGETIVAEEIEPPARTNQNQRERFGEEIHALWLRGMQRYLLRERILSRLVEAFRRERGLLKTEEADIQAYWIYQRRHLEQRLKYWQDRRDDCQEQLADDRLSGEDRLELALRMQQLSLSIATLESDLQVSDRDDGSALVPGPWRAAAETTVAEWKIGKALFECYGGVVVGGAGGLEPVGAWQSLLEEGLQTGKVVVFDAEFQDLFDHFQLDLPAKVFPVSRRQAEEYWREPWWTRPAPAGSTTEERPPVPGP